MKTTIDIADALLDDAKLLAAQEGLTLRELIEDGLRRTIASRRTRSPFRLRDASVGGNGTQPGIDPASWDQIGSLIYEGRGSISRGTA